MCCQLIGSGRRVPASQHLIKQTKPSERQQGVAVTFRQWNVDDGAHVSPKKEKNQKSSFSLDRGGGKKSFTSCFISERGKCGGFFKHHVVLSHQLQAS